CPLTDGNPFIISEPNEMGGRDENFSGTLDDQFSCMADLGVLGCGFEQHLASMKAALEGNPNNAGFLREDAYLAVIFIADEDDCSSKEGTDGAVFAPDTTEDPFQSELGFFDSFRCWEFGVVCNDDNPGPRDMPAPVD